MDPRLKVLSLVSLFLFLITAASCGKNDNNDTTLTSSTTGVGVSAVKSFAEVAGVVVQIVDGINEATAGAASATASTTGVRSASTIPPTIACPDGGSVDIDASGLPASYTVTAHDCAFDSGSVVIKEGTTAVVYGDFTQVCTLDANSPAPDTLSVDLDGTVSVDNVNFNLSNLNISLLNVVYDDWSSCNIDSFDGTFIGSVANGATVDFGPFAFGVQIFHDSGDILLTINNGQMAVQTPCDNDTYTLLTYGLWFHADASCPYNGILDITKQSDGSMTSIDFTADPGACNSAACQAS